MSVSRQGKETSAAVESADLIVDCLDNVIQYILCKRMVYSRDKFQDVHKFGMALVTLRDLDLQNYISTVLKAAHDQIIRGTLHRIVLCIVRISTRDVLERWQFRILPTDGALVSGISKDQIATDINTVAHRVQNETAQIIKQIGVSFLPPLDHECSFKLLLYTARATEVPENWFHAHPHFIKDSGSDEFVQLRPITTSNYKIQTDVVYCNAE